MGGKTGRTAEGGGGRRSHERVSHSKQKGGGEQDSERYSMGVCRVHILHNL